MDESHRLPLLATCVACIAASGAVLVYELDRVPDSIAEHTTRITSSVPSREPSGGTPTGEPAPRTRRDVQRRDRGTKLGPARQNGLVESEPLRNDQPATKPSPKERLYGVGRTVVLGAVRLEVPAGYYATVVEEHCILNIKRYQREGVLIASFAPDLFDLRYEDGTASLTPHEFDLQTEKGTLGVIGGREAKWLFHHEKPRLVLDYDVLVRDPGHFTASTRLPIPDSDCGRFLQISIMGPTEASVRELQDIASSMSFSRGK